MPSVSKSQQRLMGQAYAYKRGDLKSSDLNPKYADEIKKISKSMSSKKLKQFASTKHNKLPNKVSENRIMDFKSFNENQNNNMSNSPALNYVNELEEGGLMIPGSYDMVMGEDSKWLKTLDNIGDDGKIKMKVLKHLSERGAISSDVYFKEREGISYNEMKSN